MAAERENKTTCDAFQSQITMKRKHKWLCKLCIILSILLFIVLLGVALLVFVGFPILFMTSIELQRAFLFMPSTGPPKLFENVNTIASGTRNFYITVNEANNITYGVWHFLPEELINKNSNANYKQLLAKSDYPVLLHFHGNGGNRRFNLDVYLSLRRFFHVVAFDYRSYGDSSSAEITEEGLIRDCANVYLWLKKQTPAKIFVWGHSMGAALATHTIARLSNINVIPMGLVLESPYTTLREEASHYSLSKIISWVPWFNATILDSLKMNGFRFETTEHILKVNCPIMILHAKDDNVIPYFLGEKLSKIATEKRNTTSQGNVTFHLFPAELHYQHWAIYKSPKLPELIKNHIEIGQAYNNLNIV